MKTITVSALAALLANLSGVTDVTFLSTTNARARVNPFGSIRKESRVTGKVGGEYGFEVNKALDKQGNRPNFKAAPRRWGKRQAGLVTKAGKSYMAVDVVASPFPRFLMSDGREVAKEVIQRYLPARYFSQRQKAKGLEQSEQVKHVTYALENISQIMLDGVTYRVVRG